MGVIMKNYIIKILNGMALGLFSSLIIGLILKQIGTLLELEVFLNLGSVAQFMMGPAIGAAVASSIGAPPLGVFASIITGAIGAGSLQIVDGTTIAVIGEPVGALVASYIGAEISKLISGKTKLDIILIPALTIISGGIAGIYIAPFVAKLMTALGSIINIATEQDPLPMGILVAVLMGMMLTLPISSAAIAISLGLTGLAAGAATVGCSVQMIGFAVMSFKENGIGGFIAQGLGTSMLQIPNIIKNPKIWIPPILTSAILGPISTVVFKMEGTKLGAGMGTSGLVGQFATFEVMGSEGLFGIVLLHFVLPIIITLIISKWMRSKGLIKVNDMKITS